MKNKLPEKLLPLRPYLIELDNYANKYNLSIAEIALNYNLQNTYIDGVLIGVDTKEQLLTNFKSIKNINIDLDLNINEICLLKHINWN